MLAAQDVAALCKERGITALHIKLRATGGTRYSNTAKQSAGTLHVFLQNVHVNLML